MVAPAVTKVEGHDVAGVGEHVDVSQVRRHRLDRNADSCLQPVNWSLFLDQEIFFIVIVRK